MNFATGHKALQLSLGLLALKVALYSCSNQIPTGEDLYATDSVALSEAWSFIQAVTACFVAGSVLLLFCKFFVA